MKLEQRERPQVVIDSKTGHITHLFNGATLRGERHSFTMVTKVLS